MKKILITGENSYIGTSVEKWLGKHPDKYTVDTVDTKGDDWNKKDFSEYDVVFHVAGIAHIKETKKNQDLYYKVNRDLAYEIAKKSKKCGVKQFVFLSTMSVYGLNSGAIDENTQLKPKNHYGKSKLQAERLIEPLNEYHFSVAVLRPPMVYGKGCKGNYAKLEKLAQVTPIFPDINNKRSMIYIDNLCEFVRLLIDDCLNGLFLPQNKEYVNTREMVRLIAHLHDNNIKMTKLFNPLIRLFNIKPIKKVFGNLIYNESISNKVSLINFKESIKLTVK